MEGFEISEPKPWEPKELEDNIEDDQDESDTESEISTQDVSETESENEKPVTIKKIKPHSTKRQVAFKEILQEDLNFFPEDIL